jgi:triosephosphate isomerase (TIM)
MLRRNKLVVGNWKMHGNRAHNAQLLGALVPAVAGQAGCAVAVCVPFPYLWQAQQQLAGSSIRWGAQDVSAHAQGAFTGEVSAPMLADLECTYVIVGHSERRAHHGETSETVGAKAARALASGLQPIVCVGETLAEREAGRTEEVVSAQLDACLAHLDGQGIQRIVVAYEPVWAIGTGRSATPEMAQAVHQQIRAQLLDASAGAVDVPLLYGGSVKPDSAAALFAKADIDGGLIGGASLVAQDFLGIIAAANGLSQG